MQNIEESALSTCQQTIPLWLRYVDDTFTAVRHDEIDAFHHHLNERNTDIQFTREIEENGKLLFLHCRGGRDDNSLRTAVYRKPTNTDRLLDESSYNPTLHKATTIRTLTPRAQLVCNTTDSLSDKNKYLDRVFSKNNYNEDFIQRNTHRPTTTTEANDNATPTTTITIPYIKGISENISRILQPFNSLTNLLPHYVSYWLTSKTNRGTDREQCIGSIARTVTPPTSVRLAEISQLDWLNTNERQGRVMSTITLLKCETYETHYRLGLCAMPNLQHQLISTTDLGKLVY